MKTSPNLYGRMDNSKFWCFPWFSENSLLCVILRYTVYLIWLLISSLGLSWLLENNSMSFLSVWLSNVKTKRKIAPNFRAFSEYMNFPISVISDWNLESILWFWIDFIKSLKNASLKKQMAAELFSRILISWLIMILTSGMIMNRDWHKENNFLILKMGMRHPCNPWRILVESQIWDC